MTGPPTQVGLIIRSACKIILLGGIILSKKNKKRKEDRI